MCWRLRSHLCHSHSHAWRRRQWLRVVSGHALHVQRCDALPAVGAGNVLRSRTLVGR